MKKVVFTVLAGMVLLSGCAKDGLAVNTIGENKIDRYYKEGSVVNQKKAIIDDREIAMLTGAGVGAAGGAAAGSFNKNGAAGALVGAALGGLVGAVVGNEVVAYETTIQSKDEKVVGFLKEKLPLGTVVEYTIKDGKLKNVEVVALSQSEFKIIK
ncbi:MAG: glycine zipper domain-containing protein [Sulfurimonas sp.]|uniref:glycine zipper domain-containing protein n=1 Tax=Sulfurimonas sp. TaxID=2022749 RepID=UPI002606EA00|nr:glycine zipper domain-containing protein [Sulfurimonas sp.]MDD5373310.1 glycine zipper domain-containing protein [Sulfurimonas sp.]